MEKLGLDSSNLKTQVELNGHFLKPGESEKVIFPKELDSSNGWRVKEWFFEKGELIKPGDIVGAVESREQRFEFESFVGGEIDYLINVGQKVDGGMVLFEIKG